jgi:Family of unknown function (DUF6084)
MGTDAAQQAWAHSTVSVGEFEGTIETILPVPCTYDLNVAATKYFSALDGGTISLLFLFSGTVFYAAADRRLQVERISWNKECVFQMPVSVWQEMMDQHYPNSAWIYLHRDVFERVVDYKRDQGLPTWEATLERLLPELQSSDPDHECFASCHRQPCWLCFDEGPRWWHPRGGHAFRRAASVDLLTTDHPPNAF